jgi:hypothetical protein
MSHADPTPRRRWFRWSLAAMFVATTITAMVIAGWLKYSSSREWVDIAYVGDHRTANAMEKLLAKNGIECGYEGSLTYVVSVRRRDAPRACQLIRTAGASLGGFQTWIADY